MPCLDDEQLAALVELGRRVERHFGGHQDVEWAIDAATGELFVLQSRPVTDGAARSRPRRPSAMSLVMETFGATRDLLMALTDDDVREILRLIDESELDELRIETAGFKLHVVRGAGEPRRPSRRAGARAGRVRRRDGDDRRPDAGHVLPRGGRPAMAPFVDVGAQVEPDTVVCIIEIMKMMNSVPAGWPGRSSRSAPRTPSWSGTASRCSGSQA